MTPRSSFPYPISGISDVLPEGGGGIGVFDSQDALDINHARMAHLNSLQLPLAGKTVLDVGSGVGHLARFFVEQGCQVTCVDARPENIAVLRSRYQDIRADVLNVEMDSLDAVGQFDIVFCYGLLYHLENPLAALRNMARACSDLLLLETVISDSFEPILRLEDEPAETPNQALGGLGNRPSPGFVVMALARAGFPYIYGPISPPNHPDFEFKWQNDLESSRDGHLLRCIFLASRHRLANPALSLLLKSSEDNGSKTSLVATERHIPKQELIFEASWSDPTEALEAAKELVFVRPLVPYPGWSFSSEWDNPDLAFRTRRQIWQYFNERKLEMPFVFNWHRGLRLNLYMGNDLSRQLFIGGCSEPNAFFFLNQILGQGMVFIDVGANDGLFSLFASQRVGDEGMVWAFEPSDREFTRLEQNLTLNQLRNVRPFRIALADHSGDGNLAIAGFEHEGQNTLGDFVHRRVELIRTERVSLRALDDLVGQENLLKVDVIKLDVEGAEQRVLEGARGVLSRFRPIVLFEALDPALQKQGGSVEKLIDIFRSLQYRLFTFSPITGLLTPASSDSLADNMIAMPAEHPIEGRFMKYAFDAPSAARSKSSELLAAGAQPFILGFNPASAYWNQRVTLADSRDRILSLRSAVDQPLDLLPYQWAQIIAAALEYEPDMILQLGRGKGNATCAFTEACNLRDGRSQVLSVCSSDDWERQTLPRLRRILPDNWFAPLEVKRVDILKFDYRTALAGAKRVLIFWDAHGFDIAECVLGSILPIVAEVEHLVIMHDLSDARYNSEEQLRYAGHGLWKANGGSGPRVKLGLIDSAVEQSVAALDFTTRNRLTLDSADHSFRTSLTPAQQVEMRNVLGELFDLQGHWFYFTLNERPGPYTFPQYTPPAL